MSRSTLMGGAVALLIAGCLFSTLFGLGVKYVVDIIALGHSLAKTLLFLLFVFFLSLLVKWWPPVSARWSYRFAALLPVLFVGNLIQYLWYCRSYELNVNDWSAVIRDGFWTMSRLDHTHTAKAMLSALPKQLAETTDVGYAFGAIFPQPLLWLQLVLFLLTIGACTLSCVHWLRNERPGRSVSFVLCSFVLVKCLIDGGLLIPEVWAAVPVFCGLLFGRRGWMVGGGATLLYAGSMFFWKTGASDIVALDLLPGFVALSTPLLWARNRIVGIVALACVIVSPAARYQLVPDSRFRPHAVNTIVYAGEPLKAGWKVYIVSVGRVAPLPGPFTPESELFQSETGYCLTTVTLTADTTPLELSSLLGLEVARRPVSWYQGPVEVAARVQLREGEWNEILDQPVVESHQLDGDRVRLRMIPGVNRDMAISVLGPHLSVVDDFRFSYPE